MVKFVETNPLSDPDMAARRLIEIANGVPPIQRADEKINGPFLFEIKGTPAQYKAGLLRAIEKGWITLHESGTFIRFTQAGKDLFA